MSTAFDYEALEEAGLEVIKISYSGSNDEGFVNEIEVLEPTLPPGVAGVNDALYRSLEQEAYDLLEVKHGGWEINEGADGHITVNVKERKAFIHHGEHYESTNWHDSTV